MSLARTVALTTASLVAGRVLAVLAGIGAVALASRYLGVEGFGALTLAMAIVSLVAVLTDLGMSTMAAREIAREPEREREIVGNVRTLGLVLGLASAVVLLGVAEVAYAGDPDVRRAIFVLSAQLLSTPFVSAARAHMQATQRGPAIAVGDVVLAVAMLVASLVVVEADLGFTAMVGAVAAGYVAQALAMTGLMRRGARSAWSARRSAWGVLLRISLPLGATMIVNFLYFRLDVVLLSILTGNEAVAVYGLAYRVLEGLMVFPAYFMLALFPEIARLTGQKERVDGIVRAALGAMEVLVLPLVLVFVLYADEVILLIGGERFDEAAWVLRILMLALAISYLSGVYGNALPALGLQNQMFRWSLVVLGFNLVANLVLIPPFGAPGAAVAVVLSEVVGFMVVRRLYAQVGTAPRPAIDARILFAGAVMAATMAPLLLLPDDPAALLLTVGLGGAAGFAAYAAALIALRAVPAPIAAHLPRSIPGLGRNS
jgi:O-antigen/teichoic acid export membrane protein